MYNFFQLQKQGFRNIDGLDPASEMLILAQKTGIYRNIICCMMNGYKSTPIENGMDLILLVCYNRKIIFLGKNPLL